MTQVVPFNFENFSIRVVTGEDGEPWFVASDVCEALTISNSRDALSRLDDDEKGVAITDTLGGQQQVTIINESGLYSLTLTSRKPEAKRFKKWITSEVLPSIRKTGGYTAKPKRQPRIPSAVRDQVSSLLMVGKAMSKVKGVNESLVAAYTLSAIEQATGLPTSSMARALPSVAQQEMSMMNATQVGEALGLSARDANLLLERSGFIRKDEANNWRLTDSGAEHGETKIFHRNGHSGYEIRWKRSVIDAVRSCERA